MKEFELENLPFWSLLSTLILPFFWEINNVFVVELILLSVVLLMNIFNHKKVIIKDELIYIEKYLWVFKKKRIYSINDITSVHFNTLRVPAGSSNVAFYFKAQNKKESVYAAYSEFIELHKYFKNLRIPMVLEQPDYFK